MNIFKNILDSFLKLQILIFGKFQDIITFDRKNSLDVNQQLAIENRLTEKVNMFLVEPESISHNDKETQDLLQVKTSIEIKNQFTSVNIPKHGLFSGTELEDEILRMNVKAFELEIKSKKINKIQIKNNSLIDNRIKNLSELLFKTRGRRKKAIIPLNTLIDLDSQPNNKISVFERFDSREKERIRQEELLRKEIIKSFSKIETAIRSKQFNDARKQIDLLDHIIEPTNFLDLKEKLKKLRQKHDSERLIEQERIQLEILRQKREKEEKERLEREAAIEEERLRIIELENQKRKEEEKANLRAKEKAAKELQRRLIYEEEKKKKILEAQRIKKELEENERDKAREHLRQLEERERARVAQLNSLLVKKSNWQEFQRILSANNITTLYHFTDRANVRSIKQNGGLFSWHYCDSNGIDITFPGGGPLSRDLDLLYDLQDYVRVCFTTQHPMMYVAQKDGRIPNPVILKIDPGVCFYRYTKFSDMNAAKTGHNCGDTLDDLKRIKFSLVKLHKHFDIPDEEDRKYYQAEILVKTWIPIEAITNINTF